mmetsp:Transcript_6585/g.16401  ORF Transcript_6585/g.16401 Transcript_6585/m.16401 type:complete len:213 (-) Transcript_6585:68-706(-)
MASKRSSLRIFPPAVEKESRKGMAVATALGIQSKTACRKPTEWRMLLSTSLPFTRVWMAISRATTTNRSSTKRATTTTTRKTMPTFGTKARCAPPRTTCRHNDGGGDRESDSSAESDETPDRPPCTSSWHPDSRSVLGRWPSAGCSGVSPSLYGARYERSTTLGQLWGGCGECPSVARHRPRRHWHCPAVNSCCNESTLLPGTLCARTPTWP